MYTAEKVEQWVRSHLYLLFDLLVSGLRGVASRLLLRLPLVEVDTY